MGKLNSVIGHNGRVNARKSSMLRRAAQHIADRPSAVRSDTQNTHFQLFCNYAEL